MIEYLVTIEANLLDVVVVRVYEGLEPALLAARVLSRSVSDPVHVRVRVKPNSLSRDCHVAAEYIAGNGGET